MLGGRKVKLPRPRVRHQGREVELETYRQLRREDPLDERALEQMLVGVSSRKYARSLEPVPTALEETGDEQSAVSRRFVATAKTQEQLEAALSKPLGDRTWLALLIDGNGFAEGLPIRSSAVVSEIGYIPAHLERVLHSRKRAKEFPHVFAVQPRLASVS